MKGNRRETFRLFARSRRTRSLKPVSVGHAGDVEKGATGVSLTPGAGANEEYARTKARGRSVIEWRQAASPPSARKKSVNGAYHKRPVGMKVRRARAKIATHERAPLKNPFQGFPGYESQRAFTTEESLRVCNFGVSRQRQRPCVNVRSASPAGRGGNKAEIAKRLR